MVIEEKSRLSRLLTKKTLVEKEVKKCLEEEEEEEVVTDYNLTKPL
jgi:hypothetical protein